MPIIAVGGVLTCQLVCALFAFHSSLLSLSHLREQNPTCLLSPGFFCCLCFIAVAHIVKNPPARQETWVQSLGGEDAMEKGMATHCGILAWRIPGTEEPGGLQSMGPPRVGHN